MKSKILACSSLEELQSLKKAWFTTPNRSGAQGWRLGFRALPPRLFSLPGPADALEGVVEDITELHLLERKLQQAHSFS